MGELIHRGRIKIVMEPGRIRRAYFEGYDDPVVYGLHGGVKTFYKAETAQEQPTTLEHIAAALAG